MTSLARDSTLRSIRTRLDRETDGVPRESVERHYQNLERLAASLRGLGLNDEQVDAQVLDVFDEYRQRLSEYITIRQQENPT